MKILVLGATGGTGLELVRQAVARGHDVTAFVRSPERLGSYAKMITVKTGNLLDHSALREVVRGQDAVLSAFGPRVPIASSDRHLLREFATALSQAMVEAGVRRVIVESAAFLFKDAIFPPAYLIGSLFFSRIVADASEMESVLKNSSLDWTLVRPPKLTHGNRSGTYRTREGHLPAFGFSISRADVADCFLKLLEEPASIRKTIGASH